MEHIVLFLETKAALCSNIIFPPRFFAWNQQSSPSIIFCYKQDLIRNYYLTYDETLKKRSKHMRTIYVIYIQNFYGGMTMTL